MAHEIKVERREAAGKGASRRLRHTDKVPAIVYGGGLDPVTIQLSHNEVWLAQQNEWFYSSILNLSLNGDVQKVLLRDIQRHPYRQLIMHLDFQRVSDNEVLRIAVPLHFINEDACVGLKAGGVVHRLATEVEVGCLPKDLPEFIAVDLAGVELGQGVRLSELVLPAGVELSHPVSEETDRPVVMVARPHGGEEAPAAEAAAATPTAAP